MRDPEQEPEANEGTEPAKVVMLACAVLATGASIGKLTVGKDHKCRLPKDQVEALAALNPPLVRIDGI